MRLGPISKSRHLGIGALLALCLGAGACPSPDKPPGETPSPSNSGTFARLQSQIFATSCTSASCHSEATHIGGLALTGDAVYADLVGAQPANAAARAQGLKRIAAGDPDRSFLLRKLSGSLGVGMGQPMPAGTPVKGKALQLVKAWIEAGAPRDGLVPGDDGAPIEIGGCGPIPPPPGVEAHTIACQVEPLPQPTRGAQIHVTAPAVPRGQENTTCHYLKLPSETDLDVSRYQLRVKGGSHHIHVYRPFDRKTSLPDATEDCNQAVDFDKWELVVATQLSETDWELPPGVAYHFRAGEQLLVQTHFVNVGQLETEGEGQVWINLNAAEPGTVKHHAGSLFGQDRDVLVPAESSPTLSADCVFPDTIAKGGITLMSMTGHYHFRGRRFDTYLLGSDGALGANIYQYEGYEDPLSLVFGAADAPHFTVAEGLRWSCTYENTDKQEYTFGPYTDKNEHCNLFAFYYPTNSDDEAIYCVKKDGVSRTTVRAAQ